MKRIEYSHEDLTKQMLYITGIREQVGANFSWSPKAIREASKELLDREWIDLRKAMVSPKVVRNLKDHRDEMYEFKGTPPSTIRLAAEELLSHFAPYILKGHEEYLAGSGDDDSLVLFYDVGIGGMYVYRDLRLAEAAAKGEYAETITQVGKFIDRYNMIPPRKSSPKPGESEEARALMKLLEKDPNGTHVVRDRVAFLWSAQKIPALRTHFMGSIPEFVLTGAALAEKAYKLLLEQILQLPPLEGSK